MIQFSQQSGPAGCHLVFTPPSAPANANGSATTTVTLPPRVSLPVRVAATQNGVTATTTIRENGCLPFTAGDGRAPAPTSGPSVALILLAGALLIGGGVSLVRRAA